MYIRPVPSIFYFCFFGFGPPTRVSMNVAKWGVKPSSKSLYHPTNSFENFLVYIVLWIHKPTHFFVVCVH